MPDALTDRAPVPAGDRPPVAPDGRAPPPAARPLPARASGPAPIPYTVTLSRPDDYEGWRDAARSLVMAGVAPEDVTWLAPDDPVPLLAGGPPPAPPPDAPAPRVPRAFPDLAEKVIQHRDPARFALLHTLLHRLQSERHLLEVATDPAVARAESMAKAVRRDAHKMHAFVRFREVIADDEGALSAPIREALRVGLAPMDPAPARDARATALALRDLGAIEEAPAPAAGPPEGPDSSAAATAPGAASHLSETDARYFDRGDASAGHPTPATAPLPPPRPGADGRAASPAGTDPAAAPSPHANTAAPTPTAAHSSETGAAPPSPADAPASPTPASRFVAWYEPDHHVLRAEAGFFVRRFAALRWSILTPDLSAHWDGQAVRFGPGARRSDAPSEDAAEALWRTYFANIFNPARLKPEAMRAEMPKKFWRNLPEARDIPRLIEEAPRRVAEMVARGATPPAERRQRPVHLPAHIGVAKPPAARDVDSSMPADLLTDTSDYPEAQAALKRDLLARNDLPPWVANATQPVMGEGPQHPLLMFIGEQPGDEEDLAGRPFVGPAGRLWNKALEEAQVPRGEAYVTNAVKHFKFTPTGKRRLHQSPDAGDITYYRPFLQREIALVQPHLIVTLGATALRAVSGRAMPVTKLRGSLLKDPEGLPFYPTVHPSYLLRLPDPASKAREYDRFVEDLAQAAATARALPAR